MTPEERIRELARKNAIEAAAAERLLAAIGSAKVRAAKWDPFERLNPITSTLLGVAGVAGMVLLSRLHVRSPGFLDLRATDAPVPVVTALLDQIVTFPLPVVVLWAVARAFARRVRLIDMAAAVGLTRATVTVLALPLALLGAMRGGARAVTDPLTIIVALVALVVVTAEITLLVLGFRSATALRGARLTISVVLALFAAEFASYLVRALLPG